MAIQISGNTVINNSRRFFGDTTCRNFLAADGGRDSYTGADHIAIGYQAGNCASTVTYCSSSAGTNLTNTPHANIILGYQSGLSNQDGTCNINIGYQAAYMSNGCSFSYFDMMGGTTSGRCKNSDNIVMGTCANYCGLHGTCNIIMGYRAACKLGREDPSTGHPTGIVIMGTETGCSLVNAEKSVIIGSDKCKYMLRSYCNTALGAAINTNTCNYARFNDTAIGAGALDSSTTSSYNTAVGMAAGYQITTARYNTLIGYYAGNGSLGLENITTTGCRVIVGNCYTTVARVKVNWTVGSDIRHKCVWGNVPHGKDFLKSLTPIEYSFIDYDTEELADERRRYGFSAQEVNALEGDNEVISNSSNPDLMSLTYEYFIPVLVNAIKELDSENQSILERLNALESA